MEYMNRAERRRAKRQGEKVSKPPVYNYTPGTLRNQLDYEAKADVREKLKKVREEATADAINTAMMLLLTLPCNVLILSLVAVSVWNTLNDPTTKGLGDSERAKSYTDPQ